MYLAQTNEYKGKFELFITHPTDSGACHELSSALEVLMGGWMCEHTSYHVKEGEKRIYGWALFPIEDPEVEPSIDPAIDDCVKAYIKERFLALCHETVEFGPRHDRSRDWILREGIEVRENVEVECFFFYDDVSRYE